MKIFNENSKFNIFKEDGAKLFGLSYILTSTTPSYILRYLELTKSTDMSGLNLQFLQNQIKIINKIINQHNSLYVYSNSLYMIVN